MPMGFSPKSPQHWKHADLKACQEAEEKASPTESRPWPKVWEQLGHLAFSHLQTQKPLSRKIIPDGNTCVAASNSVKASAKAPEGAGWRSKDVYNMWGSSFKGPFLSSFRSAAGGKSTKANTREKALQLHVQPAQICLRNWSHLGMHVLLLGSASSYETYILYIYIYIYI